MKDNIAKMLVESGCYVNSKKTSESMIKTSNGDSVNAYLSCRLAISNVNLRNAIEEELAKLVQENYNNEITIVGMATAGITWAHAIAKNLGLPMLYIRSSEKTYGLKGMIEGNLKFASKKALIVDDVLYTGSTMNKGKQILENVGIKTVGVSCIATLGENITKKLKLNNINLLSLTNYKEILLEALKNNTIDEQEYENLKKIYEER